MDRELKKMGKFWYLSSKWVFVFLQEFVNFARLIPLLQLLGRESKPQQMLENVRAAIFPYWISPPRHFYLCLSVFSVDLAAGLDCSSNLCAITSLIVLFWVRECFE